jgi:predicted alpha-1,6-mannanase (GH76 family)
MNSRANDWLRRWLAWFCPNPACLVCGLMFFNVAAARAFTAADADLAFEGHRNAFYEQANGCAWYQETTAGGKASFWTQAEQLEMVLDACERSADASRRQMFTNLFRGFIADHGRLWTNNDFNDDIMWMVIACARGGLLTGNPEFIAVARTNFDACFARAWSPDLGGGLWWKTDQQSKNACVNGPAAIAAALLARACPEPAYRETARRIFAWERATLFDPGTGRVFDHIRRGGQVARQAFSYNQGTFVGAANFLDATNEAALAAEFAMNQLSHDGLLPAYGESGDAAGFNGICVRWVARFMKDRGGQSRWEPWLQKNADTAWRLRDKTRQLAWGRGLEPTPDRTLDSWSCSSAVVMLQVVRPTETTRPARP